MMPPLVVPPSPSSSCQHRDAEKSFRVCAHLWAGWINQASGAAGTREYVRRFSGRGLDRELFCTACHEQGFTDDETKVQVCAHCFREIESNCRRIGDLGAPAYLLRDAGLRLESFSLPPLPEAVRITKVAPIHLASGSQWLAVTDRHEIEWIDGATGEVRRVGAIADWGLPLDQELSLIVSARGDLMVVAATFGSAGVVVDVASGKAIMTLNRGDYYTGISRFSAAFFEHDGQTLLVHATDWNRLDISEPRSGRLLTSREPTSYKADSPRPPHYLDYFHCALSVSPDGTWMADSGWVWGSFSVVRTWYLRAWLTRNVWESEDGASVHAVGDVDHVDAPLCWLNHREIAFWSPGGDETASLPLPGVRILDVVSGEERAPLVGPLGLTATATRPGLTPPNHTLSEHGMLEFDQYLFAWSPAAGFSAWDLADGARLFEKPDFCPLAYNRTTRQFFSQDSAGNCLLSTLRSS